MKKEAISSAIWRRYLLLLPLLMGVLACDSAPPSLPAMNESPSLKGVVSDLQDRISTASQEVAEVVAPHARVLQDLTQEEVSKLFRWEYKVVDVAEAVGADGLQTQLNNLGAANWECFSIIPSGVGLRVTCKKRPVSAVQYLKHIPGL